MATVFKRKIDRRRRNAKWTIGWYAAEERRWRQSSGYSDKESSLQKGRRLETASARRAEGLSDPLNDHRQVSIMQHLDHYIAKIKVGRRSETYVAQVRNRITRIIAGVKARRIAELDPVNVACFVDGLRIKSRDLSGVTKNEYFTSMKGFTSWALTTRRAEVDPLISLKKLERRVVERTHPRRSLSPTQVGALLRAAAERPLREIQTIRTGKNKGKPLAKVSPIGRRCALRRGQERRLCYLLAVWAGLRRSEIAQLAWGDVDLDNQAPLLRLRREATKSRRADSVVIHAELARALRAHRNRMTSERERVVSTVPSMTVFRADLILAGVDRGDRETGFIDFHAFRKTFGTTMAAAGITPRTRQAHMRHTDPRLTENTYIDERLLPIAAELALLPPFETVGHHVFHKGVAQNMHKACGSSRHDKAQTDNVEQLSDRELDARGGDDFESQQDTLVAGVSEKRQRRAPRGTRRNPQAGDEIRTHDIHVGNV